MFSLIRNTRRLLASAALTAALGLSQAAPAWAEEAFRIPPYTGQAFQPAPYRFAPPPPAPVPVKAQNDQALGEILGQLGYAPVAKSDATHTEYLLTVLRKGCRIEIAAFLNNDRNVVCFASQLEEARVDLRAPGAAENVLKLMAKNTETGPVYFAYNEKDQHIWVLMQLSTEGATASVIAQAVNRFADTVQDTQPLWRARTGPPRTTTAPRTTPRSPPHPRSGWQGSEPRVVNPGERRRGRRRLRPAGRAPAADAGRVSSLLTGNFGLC